MQRILRYKKYLTNKRIGCNFRAKRRGVMFREIKPNVGFLDRVIRTGIGVGLLYVGLTSSPWAGPIKSWMLYLLDIIGGLILFTAAGGVDPVYSFLGFSTVKK